MSLIKIFSLNVTSVDIPFLTCGPYVSALTKVYEKANSVVSYAVVCPTWLHKYIIGKKGASIQKLTSELTKVPSKLLDQKRT